MAMVHARSFLVYLFWLGWSVIVGGMLTTGAILAPLAFYQLPLLLPQPELAHQYSSFLFTLFFSRFLPFCAIIFLTLTVLEHLAWKEEWKNHRRQTLLREFVLIAGNGIWIYLAFSLAPEMRDMVTHSAEWVESATRVRFQTLHQWSRVLSQAGLVATLLLPPIARYSGVRIQ